MDNVSVEQEVAKAKELAPSYSLLADSNPFRDLITFAVYDACVGDRSVESFLDFMGRMLSEDDLTFPNLDIDVRTLFINSLKSTDLQIESWLEMGLQGDQKEQVDRKRTNLIAIIKGAHEKGILSEADNKIHFSSQILQDAGIIQDKKFFDRRLVRLNTSMLYKQNKFNLHREDNAGFTGLIDDLIMGSMDIKPDKYGRQQPTPLERLPFFLQRIASHIGNFHLDPNRVLDILLDYYIREITFNHAFWIQLLRLSGWIQIESSTDEETQNQIHSTMMAQLLGFKFMYYQFTEKKNVASEYYYAVALLIKHRLIKLEDILPYMLPYEKDMEALRKDYLEFMDTEINTHSGGMLAQFGALGEDGSTEMLAPEPKANLLQNPKRDGYTANDIVELAKALLSIGDVAHAEVIFYKYDKLIELHPELAHSIYRICDVMLDPVWKAYVPETVQQGQERLQQSVQRSELKRAHLDAMPELKPILTTLALRDGKYDLKQGFQYHFFYHDWKDSIPTCKTHEDLITVFLPFMKLAKFKTYLAPNLIKKLSQIVHVMLDRETDFMDSRKYSLSMIREVFLPAVSFSKCNPGTNEIVWELLNMLSYKERCALYGEWANDFYKKSTETKLLKVEAERGAKDVMRRVSKSDVRQCGRELGKLATCNPLIVFNIVLEQIQNFDNMAPLMADGCRYLSSLSYDILGYLLTEKWTGSRGAGKMKRPKTKPDGLTSTWLRALSVFTGMLFKKQGIDPEPLLRYMVYRLRYDDSVQDLVLFNEFITKLSGIEILGNTITEEQIISAGCSETIKNEAFQAISADNRRASKRVLTRLKEALLQDGTGLELLVLLYRLYDNVSSEMSLGTHQRGAHLDHIHQTILQYTELLTTVLEPAEYKTMLPTAKALKDDLRLAPNVIMQIIRPVTQDALRTAATAAEEETTVDVTTEPHPLLAPVVEQTTAILDASVTETLSPEFYATFWQLDLYDICFPEQHYATAIQRQSDIVKRCQETRALYQDKRAHTITKPERQAQAMLDALEQDMPRHKAHVERITALLRASQARWFSTSVDRLSLISSLIQHCLLPRSMFSEVDAVYCFEFIMRMHAISARNFSSLTLFDKVLSESLPIALLTFTEYETTIHARFITRMFAKLAAWHKDEKLYTEEAHGDGLIGFQKKWNPQTSSQEVSKDDLLGVGDFNRVTHKWHIKTSLAFEQALMSGESHQIRNAFLILRQFIPYFPMVKEHGQAVLKAAQDLAQREDRDHLKVLARSYLGLIEKYKSKWIFKDVFLGHKTEAEVVAAASPAPPQSPSKPAGDSRRRQESANNNTTTTPSSKEGSRASSRDRKRERERDAAADETSSSSKRTRREDATGAPAESAKDEINSSSRKRAEREDATPATANGSSASKRTRRESSRDRRSTRDEKSSREDRPRDEKSSREDKIASRDEKAGREDKSSRDEKSSSSREERAKDRDTKEDRSSREDRKDKEAKDKEERNSQRESRSSREERTREERPSERLKREERVVKEERREEQRPSRERRHRDERRDERRFKRERSDRSSRRHDRPRSRR